jgi:polynucleotide 5'-kinase involved in rRNA processing
MLAGVARLIDRARDHAVGAIILDTTGLIDPAQGGHALKWALMDILQPSSVIGLVYRDELSTLLAPVQARAREAVIELPPASRARPRSTEERRAYRSTRFREHFEGAHTHGVPWGAFGVFPERQFERRRLLSIEDRAGFTLGLGIVTGLDRASKRVILKTPLASLEAAAAIRLADILLDPNSFRETKQRLDQSR